VLLTNINSLGKKSGLEIKTFRPTSEIDRGFFAEVPIELEFFGAYHDIGIFFDRIARLSRIVNVTELDMKLSSYRGETPQLEVSGIATTFKFVDRAQKQNAGGG
jgi:type IV pilus assembly protein PilO